MKTRKSVSNRFKLTKTGKLLHASSFGRHLKRNKSKSQKRSYRGFKVLSGKTAQKFARLLGK